VNTHAVQWPIWPNMIMQGEVEICRARCSVPWQQCAHHDQQTVPVGMGLLLLPVSLWKEDRSNSMSLPYLETWRVCRSNRYLSCSPIMLSRELCTGEWALGTSPCEPIAQGKPLSHCIPEGLYFSSDKDQLVGKHFWQVYVSGKDWALEHFGALRSTLEHIGAQRSR